MKITKQTRRAAKHLFRSCLVAGALDEDRVRQVVTEVIAGRPRGYLAVLNRFQRLVTQEVNRRAATVESAVPLDAAAQSRLGQSLARLQGPGLTLAFKTNPALLGGLRIQVGSDVYDSSIQSRLAALEESF